MSENNHDCGCGCGCGDHGDASEMEDIFVTLTDENGEDVECEVIAFFPVNDNHYAALAPCDEESEDIYFFRLEEDEANPEESILTEIEDDDELELVVDAFEELVDTADFEDLAND